MKNRATPQGNGPQRSRDRGATQGSPSSITVRRVVPRATRMAGSQIRPAGSTCLFRHAHSLFIVFSSTFYNVLVLRRMECQGAPPSSMCLTALRFLKDPHATYPASTTQSEHVVGTAVGVVPPSVPAGTTRAAQVPRAPPAGLE